MPLGVVCFDLDGTLIPDSTSSCHLAAELGHAEALAAQENDYAAGIADNRQVADFDARWYKGWHLNDIHRMLESIQVLDGIDDVVAELHRRGYWLVIGTVAWRFVAEWFCGRFGFDAACGPDIHRDEDGRFTGVVSTHFDELDKVEFVRATADRQGVDLRHCVAVGDGRSDVPLFRVVGTSIALNATPAARAAATHCVVTRDLRQILALLPGAAPGTTDDERDGAGRVGSRRRTARPAVLRRVST